MAEFEFERFLPTPLGGGILPDPKIWSKKYFRNKAQNIPLFFEIYLILEF